MNENGTEFQDRDVASGRWKLWAALPLVLLAIALAATNGCFNILDDEVLILDTARASAMETLKLFAAGVGQHEHPPLSDLVVHLWLKMVPGSVFWMRLPFIFCYVGAFTILVLLARRTAGRAAAVALAWIALLSPYGFHFGRLLGWFNLMPLLVAALSYCYVRWLETESRGWLAGTMATATALLYTNYFGWMLVGLLALDAALFRKPRRWKTWVESAGALLLLAVLFAPLWPSFLRLSQHPNVQVQGSKLAAYIFDMYALLVSESFAPWFFAVGIPVALLCAVCFALTLMGTHGLLRRFFVYFLILSALLAAVGSINTKRLPFLLGWLFLPMAVAATRSDAPRLRRVLALSLGVVFAVGWFGTFQRRYYASTHFIDDWKDAVAAAMADRAGGGQLVYDHPVGGYYLGRALDGPGSPYKGLDDCHDCGAEEAEAWFADGHPGVRVVALRGVQYGLSQNPGDSYLERNCRLERERHYTRDTAAAIKRRLFPTQVEPEWRIAVGVYECPAR
jgi:hypothetical protein